MTPANKKKTVKKAAAKKEVAKKNTVKDETANTKQLPNKKVISKKAAAKEAPAKKAASKKAASKPAKTAKPSKLDITLEERWKMVAIAAYHRAEKRGFAPGHELHDWTEAEKDIAKLLRG
jgi:hypothetical protein